MKTRIEIDTSKLTVWIHKSSGRQLASLLGFPSRMDDPNYLGFYEAKEKGWVVWYPNEDEYTKQIGVAWCDEGLFDDCSELHFNNDGVCSLKRRGSSHCEEIIKLEVILSMLIKKMEIEWVKEDTNSYLGHKRSERQHLKWCIDTLKDKEFELNHATIKFT